MSSGAGSTRRWRGVLALLLGLLLIAVLVWLVIQVTSKPDTVRKKRVVQEISLLKPPPPPPPPKVEPPKVEPPPKLEVQEKLESPKPDQPPEKAAEAPPPGPALGLDAAGGTGSDSFGLAARKGGADLIGGSGGGTTIGGGGGAPVGNRFAWYGALVKDRIQDAVSRDKKLGTADFRVQVHVWINAGGAVTRVELVGSTGDAVLDDSLQQALRSLPPLREGAPGDMPQPIKLRITARG